MVKISEYKKGNGEVLVVKRVSSGSLVGELFANGTENHGKWDMRATFNGREATEYRVCEYFGFKLSDNIKKS